MKLKLRLEIARVIKTSLAFHQLNKLVEAELDISLVQYYCLDQIRLHPGISSRSLAQNIGIHPSSITSTIKRLSKRRFLFVGSDPRDSRKNMLSLTVNGKIALDRIDTTKNLLPRLARI